GGATGAGPERRRAMKALLLAFGALLLPGVAGAHPLGNFTTNPSPALHVNPGTVRVSYAVDMAELPAYREIPLVDRDGDGVTDAAERDAYAPRQAAAIAPK